jgi:hypothetical protein
MSKSKSVVFLCTPDELSKLTQEGEIDNDTPIGTLTDLFEVLLTHYGYDIFWPTNDVH